MNQRWVTFILFGFCFRTFFDGGDGGGGGAGTGAVVGVNCCFVLTFKYMNGIICCSNFT